MGWSDLADRTLRQTLRTFRQDQGAIYRRPGLEDTLLQDVIFDDTYFAVDNSTGAEVSSQMPVMGVRTQDLPLTRNASKDTIIITRRGITKEFSITNVQPDGEAGTTIFLSTKNRS